MVEASKMQAFMNEGSPTKEDEWDEDGNLLEEEEEAPRDITKFAALIPLLEEFSEDLTELSDEMDADLLLDPNAEMAPDDLQILKEGYGTLDKRLRAELSKCCPELTPDDANYLVDHLGSETVVEDPQRIAGWLYRVGQLMKPSIGAEEDMDMDEDEETDVDDTMADEDLP